MTSDNTDEKGSTSKWTIVKKRLKQILLFIIMVTVLFLIGLTIWKYYLTISEGRETGLLQKYSRNGILFKSYEGELLLDSQYNTGGYPASPIMFYFSVPDKKTAMQLDTLQGYVITVFYKEKNAALPWKGDTPYYVDSVLIK